MAGAVFMISLKGRPSGRLGNMGMVSGNLKVPPAFLEKTLLQAGKTPYILKH
jgi:hypothetical protein